MEETPRSSAQAPQPAGLPATEGWYLARGGQTYGPYTREVLEAAVDTGQVVASDQLWSPELGAWHPASSVLTALANRALPADPPSAPAASAEGVSSAPSAEAWQAPLSDAEAWKAPVQAQPVAASAAVAAKPAASSVTGTRKKLQSGNSQAHHFDAPFNSMSQEMGPVAWALGLLVLAAVGGALTAVIAFGMGGTGAAAPTGEGRDFLQDVYSLLHFFAITQAVVLVLAAVLVTRWLSHAHENLAALAGDDPVGQPVSASGKLPGFLAGPYLWLSEIWLRSSPASRSSGAAGIPPAVSRWLGWVIVGVLAAGVGILAALGSEARSGSRTGLVLCLGSLVFVALAAVATRRFEKDVAGKQDRRYRELMGSGG